MLSGFPSIPSCTHHTWPCWHPSSRTAGHRAGTASSRHRTPSSLSCPADWPNACRTKQRWAHYTLLKAMKHSSLNCADRRNKKSLCKLSVEVRRLGGMHQQIKQRQRAKRKDWYKAVVLHSLLMTCRAVQLFLTHAVVVMKPKRSSILKCLDRCTSAESF